MERREAFTFRTPTSIIIVEHSGCGKNVFTTRLLLENSDLFSTTPNTIHYCYCSRQHGFEIFIMVHRKRTVVVKCRRRKRQRGGALFRRKPRLVDKIAEGASMVLSGPTPTFASLGAKLAGRALKGITDNVKYYKRQHRCR